MVLPAPLLAARPALEAAFGYLREHPQELLRVLRNTPGLRFGLPLPAVRWLLLRSAKRSAPRDLEITAIPPGIRAGGSFDLMNTPLRAKADIYVERVEVGPERFLVEIRLANVSLTVTDDRAQTPLSALLRSGALDLSRPGNLVAYMPKRPPFLVEAKDDRIVLDLLRRASSRNGKLERWIGRVVPFLTLHSIETDENHLDVELRAFPEGFRQSLETIRRTL